jgi:hypothetical protein
VLNFQSTSSLSLLGLLVQTFTKTNNLSTVRRSKKNNTFNATIHSQAMTFHMQEPHHNTLRRPTTAFITEQSGTPYDYDQWTTAIDTISDRLWRFLPTNEDFNNTPTYGPHTARNVAHLRSQKDTIDAFFTRDVPGATKVADYLQIEPKIQYKLQARRAGFTVVEDFILLMELTAGREWKYLSLDEEWIIHHNIGP